MYFFFSRKRPTLAETVRQGMEKALADGSFDRLLQGHFADNLRRAHLSQRQVIKLENPLLPSATPLQRRDLWFSPPSRAREAADIYKHQQCPPEKMSAGHNAKEGSLAPKPPPNPIGLSPPLN
jgi:hypothetical protein